MWQIQTGNTPSGQLTLACISVGQHLSSFDRPKIVRLEIYKNKNAVVNFKIYASDHVVSANLYTKLEIIHNKREGISKPKKDNSGLVLRPYLKVRVKYEKDRLGLNDVIELLNNGIRDFHIIKEHLPDILQITKQMTIDDQKQHQKEHSGRFERYVENTMTATTHASIRLSERELREKYNFPAPVISDADVDVDDDSSEHTLPLYLNDDARYQNDYNEDEEIENDLDDELYDDLDEVQNHRASECSIISNLMDQLYDLQDKYIDTNFIKLDPTWDDSESMILTSRAIDLLSTTPKSPFNIDDIDSAKNALNVMAALRAISYAGSHYKNNGMKHTGINGYGMRNLVALIWHSCMKADSSNNLPNGVTLNDALLALAKGIADGARGGNRNRDSFDDLKVDAQTCDQGKYNSLFSAMLGIFPEIKIDFDYTDTLLQSLKSEIIREIVAHAKDNSEAKELLKIWLGEQTDDTSKSYKQLCKKINVRFPQMIELFIDSQYPVDSIELRAKIKYQINKDIKDISEKSFGISYIESVSPTHQMLDEAWDKTHHPKEGNSNKNCKRVRMF